MNKWLGYKNQVCVLNFWWETEVEVKMEEEEEEENMSETTRTAVTVVFESADFFPAILFLFLKTCCFELAQVYFFDSRNLEHFFKVKGFSTLLRVFE